MATRGSQHRRAAVLSTRASQRRRVAALPTRAPKHRRAAALSTRAGVRPIYRVLVSVVALVAVVVCCPWVALAQPVARGRLEVGPNQVKLGEPFSAVLVLDLPRDAEILWPTTIDLGGDCITLSRRDLERSFSDEAQRLQIELTILPVELGAVAVGPVTLPLRSPRGVTSVRVEARPLQVEGHLRDATTELRPISAPVPVTVDDWRPVWWGGLGLIALLIIGVIARWLAGARRRRRVFQAAIQPDLGSPHEMTLARLRELGESGLANQEDKRPLYFAMSETMRQFLGRIFGFDSKDRTSSELVTALPASTAELPWRISLATWFEETDLVKYAGVRAPRDTAIDALDRAMEIVESVPPSWEEPAAPAPLADEVAAPVSGATEDRDA